MFMLNFLSFVFVVVLMDISLSDLINGQERKDVFICFVKL